MNAVTQAADVQLVSLRDHAFLYGTIPSKLAAIMASGLPVICNAPGDTADLVRLGCRLDGAPPEDEAGLADCFRQAYGEPAVDRGAGGLKGRTFYVKHSSREVSLSKLEQVLGRADD